MIAVSLPWLAEQLERPVVALIEPFVATWDDDATIPPGAAVVLTQCPSMRVVAGLPKVDDDSAHEDLDWERWLDELLVHAIVRPKLTRRDLGPVLGPDRDTLAQACLRAWGVVAEADGTFRRVPNKALMEQLQVISIRLGVPPSVFLAMPLAEYTTNRRILTAEAFEDYARA